MVIYQQAWKKHSGEKTFPSTIRLAVEHKIHSTIALIKARFWALLERKRFSQQMEKKMLVMSMLVNSGTKWRLSSQRQDLKSWLSRIWSILETQLRLLLLVTAITSRLESKMTGAFLMLSVKQLPAQITIIMQRESHHSKLWSTRSNYVANLAAIPRLNSNRRSFHPPLKTAQSLSILKHVPPSNLTVYQVSECLKLTAIPTLNPSPTHVSSHSISDRFLRPSKSMRIKAVWISATSVSGNLLLITSVSFLATISRLWLVSKMTVP